MPEKRPVWALLADIVDRPGTALANVAAYPRWRWLLPALIAVGTLAASLALTAPFLAAQAQQAMAAQLSQLSADQAALVSQRTALFQTPLVLALIGSVTGTLALVFTWLVTAVIVYFAALVGGSDIEFGAIFATAPWLHLPLALDRLVQGIFSATQGRLIVNQGLSYLVSTGKAADDVRNLAYVALSQVSLFRLWHLILVYVLLRAVGKLGAGGAFVITVVYWALLVGAQLVMGRLAPSF